MTHSRTLAAAALIALLAGAAHAQTASEARTGTESGAGTELAPDEAVTPAERPAEVPLAPAEGAPAPAPRPGEAGPAAAGPDAREDPAEGGPAGAPAAAGADDTAPGTAPVPPLEPAAPAQAPAPEQSPGAPEAAPVPAEDPEAGAETPAAGRLPTVPTAPPVPEQLAEDDAGHAACLGRLAEIGAAFERVDPVSEEGGECGIVNPIRVTRVLPGVALDPAGVMRCETATALARWVETFVLPASRLLPERGPLAAVEHGSAYVCRRIRAGGDLSQHAFGNAVDVMAFRFAEGEPIPVEPRAREGTAAEAFQRMARASACLLFTTVLGPGQADHDDHLHLDIEARGSGYRLCQ